MNSGPMITCPKCGKENPPINVFCGTCGTRLIQPVSAGFDHISAADLTESKFLERALGNKFSIEKELGRGGFGVVFKARDLQLERTVAIKALHLTKSGDPSLVKRFIKEARLSAKLEHPNIVRIYTIDSINVIHYFMMEFVDGPTIKECLVERGVFSPYHTVRFGMDIAAALAFAHDHSIIHRDIKPANVILKNETTAIVTDFGIAKALWSEGTALTTGAIGTPMYMAPEQFRGEDIDGRSDQYSMGIMLYEMLTGDVPFMAQGTMLVQQHLFAQPPPVQQRNPDIPDQLAAMVHRMLEKRKEDRFEDCHVLYKELVSFDLNRLPRVSGSSTLQAETCEMPVSQLISEARNLIDQSEYERASQVLENARFIDPDNIDVMFMSEQIRLKRENASHLEGLIQEGISRFHEGQFTLAIEVWESACKLDETNTEIRKFIEQARNRQAATSRGQDLKAEGIRALEQNRYDTAIEKLKAAREFISDDAEIEEFLKKAMSMANVSKEVHTQLDQAALLRKNRSYDDAKTIYREILEQNPERVTARDALEKTIQEEERFNKLMVLKSGWDRKAETGKFTQVFNEIEDQARAYPEFQDWFAAAKQDFTQRKQKYLDDLKATVISQDQLPAAPAALPAISAPAPITAPPERKSVSSKKILFWAAIFALILIGAGSAGYYYWRHSPESSDRKTAQIPLESPTAVPTSLPTAVPTSVPAATNTATPLAVYIPEAYQISTAISTSTPVVPKIDTPVPPSPLPHTARPTSVPTQKPPPTARPATPPGAKKPTTEPPDRSGSKSNEEDTAETELQPGVRPQVVQRYVRMADRLKNEKHYRRSLRIVNRILTVDPGNEQAKRMRVEMDDVLERSHNMMEIAKRLMNEGDMSEAESMVDKALDLDPFNPEAREWKK